MGDPLHHFLSGLGYDQHLIHRQVAGDKYIGIMLSNGQIGVCSTLNRQVAETDLHFTWPDLTIPAHRMHYNAYINAMLNYEAKPEADKDIFEHIDFTVRKKNVMVGYFRPVVRKFMEAGIAISVFDLLEEDEFLIPLDRMNEFLSSAGTLILTSTSVANGSFVQVLRETPDSCDVFLLGPSSILHPDMKKYRNIKKIYGALFELYDHRILDIIAEGNGTQTFLKFGKKVNI